MPNHPHPGLAEATTSVVLDALRTTEASAATWLESRLGSTDLGTLSRAFALAGRKFTATGVAVSLPALPTPMAGWDAVTAARLALLAAMSQCGTSDEVSPLVRDLFYKGDTPERVAVLRGLTLLQNPDSFTLVATDGVRSHVSPIFEAIACENPYAALHLDNAAFNQLVMKAFFTEVPVRRIIGLESRLNSELRRMAADYASERRAAGRSVPSDLESVTGGAV